MKNEIDLEARKPVAPAPMAERSSEPVTPDVTCAHGTPIVTFGRRTPRQHAIQQAHDWQVAHGAENTPTPTEAYLIVRDLLGLVLDADDLAGDLRAAHVPKTGPNAVLDQTDADNFYLAEENRALKAEVAQLQGRIDVLEPPARSYNRTLARAEQAERQATALLAEKARVTRTAYVLAMDLLQSRDQLWRADDVVRAAVETAIAANQEGR